MPTYTPNIPQPGDIPAQSQDQMLQNFQEIETVVSTDHVNFNLLDKGKHKHVRFVQQTVAPTTTGTELSLYTKNVASTSQQELYYTRDALTEYQLTAGAQLLGQRIFSAYAIFSINVGAVAATITSGYNISLIERPSGSSTTINVTFTTPLLTNKYLPIVIKTSSSGVGTGAGNPYFSNVTVNGFSFTNIMGTSSNSGVLGVILLEP